MMEDINNSTDKLEAIIRLKIDYLKIHRDKKKNDESLWGLEH
jgi:hypothetical protein